MDRTLKRIFSNNSNMYSSDFYSAHESSRELFRRRGGGNKQFQGVIILRNTVYSDEFELVNPIGTNTRKHKLVAFYWILLNMPPEYNSSLVAGNLLALAKSSDLKKFGLELLLADFIDSMKLLAEGTEIVVNGSKLFVHGMLGPCSGDTPALAYVGGFKQGVGGATR